MLSFTRIAQRAYGLCIFVLTLPSSNQVVAHNVTMK